MYGPVRRHGRLGMMLLPLFFVSMPSCLVLVPSSSETAAREPLRFNQHATEEIS